MNQANDSRNVSTTKILQWLNQGVDLAVMSDGTLIRVSPEQRQNGKVSEELLTFQKPNQVWY